MAKPAAEKKAPSRGPIFALAALAAGLCTLLAFLYLQQPDSGALQRAELFDAIGNRADAISVQTADGAAANWGSFNGAPRVVFFGFTHCPEICPTTLSDLSAAKKRIGAAADNLYVDFVTLDPERDTPEALRAYIAGFGPEFRAFTAAPAELEKLVKSYRVAYRKTDTGDGAYTVDHTTLAYLLNAEGRVVDIAGYQTPPARLDAQLKALLK
jgi:protein SCO1/2